MTDNCLFSNLFRIHVTLPFIDKAIGAQKPFLATIWFHTPHLPCVAGPEYAARYQNLPLKERNYYGCITAMDDQIERLVQYLKIKGVYDNTIIFFCSDNGPELNTPGTAGNFKGKKRSLYEGGIRVPAFMIDGRTQKTGKITQPCSTSDYLPSILELANISTSVPYQLDGESFVPFLNNSDIQRQKPLVFCSGTQGAVVDGGYKLYYNQGTTELYDLKSDPFERTDVSRTYPEIRKKLSDCLWKQMKSFQQSFEGNEYGTQSVERMNQQWEDISKKK